MKALFNRLMALIALILILGASYNLGGGAGLALALGILIMLGVCVDSMRSAVAGNGR